MLYTWGPDQSQWVGSVPLPRIEVQGRPIWIGRWDFETGLAPGARCPSSRPSTSNRRRGLRELAGWPPGIFKNAYSSAPK